MAASAVRQCRPVPSTNCRPCTHKAECPFYWDMTKSASAMRLYGGEVEKVDGYLRDACVFRPEITTYDTMTATVKYTNDVIMSYSLNAYLPIEGYSLAFNGDGGRVEIRSYGGQPFEVPSEMEVYVIKAFGTRTKVDVPTVEGEHGGADDALRNLIFRRPAGGRPSADSGLAGRRHVGAHGHRGAAQLRRESAHHHLRPGHLLMSITRRSFVSSAAAGVAGGLVAGTSADAHALPADRSQPPAHRRRQRPRCESGRSASAAWVART